MVPNNQASAHDLADQLAQLFGESDSKAEDVEGPTEEVEKKDSPKEDLADQIDRLLSQRPPVGVPETVQAFGGGILSGAAEIPAGVLDTYAILENKARDWAGAETGPTKDKAAAQFAQVIRDMAREMVPHTGTREEAVRGLGSALGSGLSFMAGGAALQAVKIPGLISVAALGASVGGPVGYYEALAKGKSEDDAWNAYLLNAAVGLSEAVPIARILGRINRASGGSLQRALIDAVIEGIEESGQEAFQQTASNIIAQHIYDSERETFQGTLAGAGGGLFAGVILSVLGSGAAKARGRGRGGAPGVATVDGEPPVPGVEPTAQEGAQAVEDVLGRPSVMQPVEDLTPEEEAELHGALEEALEGELPEETRAQFEETLEDLQTEMPSEESSVSLPGKSSAGGELAAEEAEDAAADAENLEALRRVDGAVDAAGLGDRARRIVYESLGFPAPEHAADPEVRIGMSRLGRGQVDLSSKQSQKKLAEAIFRDEAEAAGLDPEGLLGPSSGLTAQGKQRRLEEAATKARAAIRSIMGEVAGEPGVEPGVEPGADRMPAGTRKGQRLAALNAKIGKTLDELDAHSSESQFFSGIPLDTKQLALLTKLGKLYVQKGYVTFEAWTERMIGRMGEKIRPHLAALWNEVKPGEVKPGEVKPGEASEESVPRGTAQAAKRRLGRRPVTPPTERESTATMFDPVLEPRTGSVFDTTQVIPDAGLSPDTDYDAWDRWLADRQEAETWAETRADVKREELRALLPRGTTKAQLESLEDDLQLYADLKGKAAAEIEKFGESLTEEQKQRLERSQNLKPEHQAFADEILAENRASGKKASEAGALRSYLELYTARIWENPEADKPKKGRRLGFGKFTLTTPRAKARIYSSILEGWAKGRELKVSGIINAQLLARRQLAQVIHDRMLIKVGLKSGIISTNEEQLDDGRKYVQIHHPTFKTEVYAGRAEPGTVYGDDIRELEDGTIMRKVPIYAHPELAKKLNNALDPSLLQEFLPRAEALTKYNAIWKQQVLFFSLFHHQAYLRSYVLGTPGLVNSLRVVKAYKEGRKTIEQYTPELRELVRAGLTIGRIQDFDEFAASQRTIIGAIIDKTGVGGAVRDALVRMRDQQIHILFHRLGPNLKVMAAIYEFRHLLKKHKAELQAGTLTQLDVAKVAAEIANDDFGGLNLERKGRNATTQHAFRLLALAPDWTESNVNTLVKAFDGGLRGKTYRAMWTRTFLRAGAALTVWNLLMAMWDDDGEFQPANAPFRYLKRNRDAWRAGYFRWMDADITTIARALGGKDDSRYYFSVLGHFKDPIKWVFHPLRSAIHKSSILAGFAIEAGFGEDWKGRTFTSAGELKETGDLVKWKAFGGGSIDYDQVPSFLLSQAKGVLPIPVQNGVSFMFGEMDAFEATTKSLGLMTTEVSEERIRKSK